MILLIERTVAVNKKYGDWFTWYKKPVNTPDPAMFYAHDFRAWFLKIVEGKNEI